MASASQDDEFDLTGLLASAFRYPPRNNLRNSCWTDDAARKVPSPHSPNVSVRDLIRMGDCMIVTLAMGPYSLGNGHSLGDLVAALALQIRDDKLKRMFPQDQFEAGFTDEDIIGQTASAKVLQEIEMYVAEEHRTADRLNRNTLRERQQGSERQFFMDLKCPENFFLRYPHLKKPDWDDTLSFFCHFKSVSDEIKAAFYCFIAVMLIRSCVKPPETLKRCLLKAEENFSFLVTHMTHGLILPTPTTHSLENLARYFKPGGKVIRQVLKVFLLHRYYCKTVGPAACEILDFTLLKHCKYNGMQMISLTETACDIEGMSLDRLRELWQCSEVDKSWAEICNYFETYSDANNPAYPMYLAPWSRLFNPDFWSELHIRKHSLLGHTLAAVCECRNPTIWQMKGLRVDQFLKLHIQKLVESYRKDKDSTEAASQ